MMLILVGRNTYFDGEIVLIRVPTHKTSELDFKLYARYLNHVRWVFTMQEFDPRSQGDRLTGKASGYSDPYL